MYEIEFYAEPSGREPVAEFLDDLAAHKRAALLAALSEILAQQGLDVCKTEYGKNLGKGLAEFRLRHTYDEIVRRYPAGGAIPSPDRNGDGQVLLRVFFHAHGDKWVLLLGGYDKGRDASRKRQDAEIKRARRRLRQFKEDRRTDAPTLGRGLGRWLRRR